MALVTAEFICPADTVAAAVPFKPVVAVAVTVAVVVVAPPVVVVVSVVVAGLPEYEPGELVLAGMATEISTVSAAVLSPVFVTVSTTVTIASDLGGRMVPAVVKTVVSEDTLLIATVKPVGTMGSVRLVASFTGAEMEVIRAAISEAL